MLLSVENLHIYFMKNKQHLSVVRQVNMQLAAGEILGIIGESGSGKSLINLALTGLLPQSAKVEASRFEFKNRDLLTCTHSDWQALRGKEIAMIFQNAKGSLNPSMKIKNQLYEGIKKYNPGISQNSMHRIAIHRLDQVALHQVANILNSYPHELSGGMAQRVMIALALAGNPALLIADEPTTGLDSVNKKQIVQLLNDIRLETNMAIILVSHDIPLIQEHTQRVHVMYSGELMESGDTHTIMKTPAHPYTQELMHCVPEKNTLNHKQHMHSIDGFILPATQTIDGCRFVNRCSKAQAQCQIKPVIKKLPDTPWFVNCHISGEPFT